MASDLWMEIAYFGYLHHEFDSLHYVTLRNGDLRNGKISQWGRLSRESSSRLTGINPPDSFPLVNRSCRYLCLLLLALWLPATLHCGLEAADLISAHGPDSRCSDIGSACSMDGCKTVEETTARPSHKSIKAPAPNLLACVHLLCLQLVVPASIVEPIASVRAFERPLAWVPMWHFARRAAPSPRAPSALV